MTAKQFLAVLESAEQDHTILAGQMQALKDNLNVLRQGTPSETPAAIDAVGALKHYFVTDFLAHLREEEEATFPALAEVLPDGLRRVAQLRADHAALREQCEQFRARFVLYQYVGDEGREQILWDLVTTGQELLRRLRLHVRRENQCVREVCDKLRHLPGAGRQPARNRPRPTRADRLP